MSYIKKNFLLENKTSELLYERYAKNIPIFDYHCHLSEKEIYEDKAFKNLYEMWLTGDHYKWRLMRNHGISEEYITGNKSPFDKFKKYCETIETAYLNPLNHWSQLELEMFFNCKLDISKNNAEKIYKYTENYLKKHKLTPSKLIRMSNVKYIFTTNEPWDDLTIFKKINKKYKDFKVYPAFRADKLITIENVDFRKNITRLGIITSFKDFEKRIEERLQAFIKVGCKASDISLLEYYYHTDRDIAVKVFEKRLKGIMPSSIETAQFKGYMLFNLLKLYAKYNIRSEIHIAVLRNVNGDMFTKLGPDMGYDVVGDDTECMYNLSYLLNRLNKYKAMPPIIIFNLNPKLNVELLTLCGAFTDSSLKGKVQLGAAWWFLDNLEGIKKHLKDYSSLSDISNFIGMLTDSRSFLSYARHQYFRRILCNFFGKNMELGLMSNDIKKVGEVIQNISYNNAIRYFDIKGEK